MRKVMKKKITAALVCALMTLSLAGCAANGGEPGDTRHTTKTENSDSEDEKKPEAKDIDWSKVPVVSETDLDYIIYEEDDIRYNEYADWFTDEIKQICSGGAVLITKYSGDSEYINLPDQIEGQNNIFISSKVNWGDNAKAIRFSEGCASPVGVLYAKESSYYIGAGIAPNVTSVVLPDSWRCIGRFNELPNLESIELPKEIRYIWSETFEGCEELETVIFPKKTAGECVIYDSAFKECKSLENIEIPEGVIQLGTDEGYVFNKCTSLKKISLPSTLKEISTYTFTGCKSLTEITLPNGLETICTCAFLDCTSLKSIDIPDSVTEIGFNAFIGCKDISINYKGKTYNEKDIQNLYDEDLSTM